MYLRLLPAVTTHTSESLVENGTCWQKIEIMCI